MDSVWAAGELANGDSPVDEGAEDDDAHVHSPALAAILSRQLSTRSLRSIRFRRACSRAVVGGVGVGVCVGGTLTRGSARAWATLDSIAKARIGKGFQGKGRRCRVGKALYYIIRTLLAAGKSRPSRCAGSGQAWPDLSPCLGWRKAARCRAHWQGQRHELGDRRSAMSRLERLGCRGLVAKSSLPAEQKGWLHSSCRVIS